MHTIDMKMLFDNKDYYKSQVLQNTIFLYPTDSLYGLGAVRTSENIQKIATIKNRPEEKKMNIIAPSRDRIEQHFILHNKDFLKEQCNAFHATTFILEPKSHDVMLYKTLYGESSVGVRLLNHPIQEFFFYCNVPFITTSANHSGESNIITIDELTSDIKTYIDYCIDDGEVFGIPSVLVFDKTKEIRIRK